MKKIFLVLIFLFSILNIGCQDNYYNQWQHPNVHQLIDSTVSLVYYNDDGEIKNFCSGIWVSEKNILTAYHCIRNNDELSSKNEIGNFVLFQTEEQDQTSSISYAIVYSYDKDNDLAMLHLVNDFPHSYVEIAKKEPNKGSMLFHMGHPGFLNFEFLL